METFLVENYFIATTSVLLRDHHTMHVFPVGLQSWYTFIQTGLAFVLRFLTEMDKRRPVTYNLAIEFSLQNAFSSENVSSSLLTKPLVN